MKSESNYLALQVVAGCMTIFIIIVGVFGNLLTIVALSKYPRVRNVTAAFIISQTEVIQGSAEFSCQVENIAGYDVMWKRITGNLDSKTELISINTTVNIAAYSGRFSVSFDASKSSFNLRLDKVQSNDWGVYICEITLDSTHSISQNTSLKPSMIPTRVTEIDASFNDYHGPGVLPSSVEPFFFNNSSRRKIIAKVGSDVRIECYAGGKPKPDVFILCYDHAPFRLIRQNVLNVHNITQKGGKYQCWANNIAGSDEWVIEVEVQGPPIIDSCALKMGYYPEFNATLECLVNSHEKPDIVWFINNQMYSSTKMKPNFETLVSFGDRVSTATLKINSTSNFEQTYYEIRANNSLGENKAFVGKFSRLSTSPPSNCGTSNCPSCSCNVYIIFMLLFPIIVVGLICTYFKNFKIDKNEPPRFYYQAPVPEKFNRSRDVLTSNAAASTRLL